MNTAQKIYTASTSEDRDASRLAERLARQIEDDIASSNIPPGGVMGSLRELSERYAVGRAAARGAVALLERRGLGRLRPGPCGGFIVAKPEAAAIGTALADYFRMIGVSREQVGDAREALDLTVADHLVAQGPDRAPLDQLPGPDAARSKALWHVMLRTALTGMTGEPVLVLFGACLDELSLELLSDEVSQPGWQQAAGDLRDELVAALESGKVEAVHRAVERLHDDLGPWTGNRGEGLALPDFDTARHADDRTLAMLVARRIAHEILHKRSPGHRLGSEWDLCEQYNVSRATLRQAIRRLQDSGLVECRRGRGHGMVVRDPRGTGSIRLVLAYLISHQVDPGSVGTLLFRFNRFMPALAIGRAEPKGRDRLAALLARTERKDPIDRLDLLRLVQAVSELSDSPIIDLFSRCLAAYEARFHPFFAERLPAHLQAEYFALLHRLIGAAASGEAPSPARAKHDAARVMLDMGRKRPL